MSEEMVQESPVEDAGGVETEAQGAIETQDAGSVADPLFADGPFVWKHKDGEAQIRNRAELADLMNRSAIFASEREQERQAREAEQKQVSEAIKNYRLREQQLQEAYGQYGEWDKLMKQHPELAQQFGKTIDSFKGSGADKSDQLKSLLEQELTPIKQAYQEWQQSKQAQAQEEAMKKAAEGLAGEYSDFNLEEARAFLNELKSVPEGDVPRSLLQLAYHALKGRNGMAALEQRTPPKGQPSVTSTPGKTKETIDTSGMNEAEKEEYAVSLLKNTPGL